MDNTSHETETDLKDDLASMSCLDALRSSKAIGWGKRMRVRYPRRKVKEVKPRMNLRVESVSESKVGGSSMQGKAESAVDERLKQHSGSKRKREGSSSSNKIKPTNIQSRWSVDRCASAKKALLDVVREMDATWHKPVLRHDLREKARKYIGDTGLLDHLLKHMAGEVSADGKDRLMRRHNTEGAIEYWLEPAELAMRRREAGITNPYWVPCSGWKPGDAISDRMCDGQCKAMISHCKDEINLLRGEIAEIKCLKKTEDSLQEKYLDLQDQVTSMKDTCQNLLMQSGMLQEHVVSMKDKYENLLMQHRELQDLVVSMQEKDKVKQVVAGDDVGTKEKTTSKSGFSNCQPDGTFVWPNMVSIGGQFSPRSLSSDMSLPPQFIVLPSPLPRPAFFCQQQPSSPRSIHSFSQPQSLAVPGKSPTQGMIHRPTARYPIEGMKRSGASSQVECGAMASAMLPKINSDKSTGDVATNLTLGPSHH